VLPSCIIILLAHIFVKNPRSRERERERERAKWQFGSGGATQPLPSDGGVEELHGDPSVGPCPKVWTRGQKWRK